MRNQEPTALRDNDARAIPLIGANDLLTIVGLLALAAIAATTPERWWTRVGRALSPFVRRFGFSGFAQRSARVAAVAGDRLATDADAFHDHVQHLERQVARAPGQWLGWADVYEGARSRRSASHTT